MNLLYQNLDFSFFIEQIPIQVLTLAIERFVPKIPRHSHGPGCYEIHYIVSGDGSVSLEHTTYRLYPGTLYTAGPYVEHSEVSNLRSPIKEYCIYFKIPPLPQGHDKLLKKFCSQMLWIGKDKQNLPMLFEEIAFEMKTQSLGFQEKLSALFQQLFIGILRNYQNPREKAPDTPVCNLSVQKSVIAEDAFLYEYQTLSLEELARRLGLSARQTERFLKKAYGKTFQEKRREARMAAALLLLAEPERNITEIAEDLGYSSLEHFTRVFKSCYQASPREFRKKLLHFSGNLL